MEKPLSLTVAAVIAASACVIVAFESVLQGLLRRQLLLLVVFKADEVAVPA